MELPTFFPYECKTYETALNQFHRYRQSKNSGWSIGAWARKLKLSSTASLTNLMKGRKLPSVELHRKIMGSIGLAGTSRIHFDLLLERSRKYAAGEDIASTERKIEISSIKARISKVSLKEFEIIATPLALALIEITRCQSLVSPELLCLDFPELGNSEEIVLTWKALLANEWIVEDPNAPSGFRSRNELIDLPSIYQSELIRRFHEMHCSMGLTAIQTLPKQERHFSSLVIGISETQISEFERELDSFREKLLAKYTSGNPTAIYQVNLHAFPFQGNKKTSVT